MSASQAYRCTARPLAGAPSGAPDAATVCRPASQSVAPPVGSGCGAQRSGLGSRTNPAAPSSPACASGAAGPRTTDGRTRYSHERWFLARGAVKAVPDSCSATKPYAHTCGLLQPTGSAPGSASLANELPKPELYVSLAQEGGGEAMRLFSQDTNPSFRARPAKCAICWSNTGRGICVEKE
jgi:hypothetical protein